MSKLDELIGRSPRIAALRERIRALLAGEEATHRLPPLLITGETGTGKSLLARIIHEASSRSAATPGDYVASLDLDVSMHPHLAISLVGEGTVSFETSAHGFT
jgi:transcriptional regulator of acetoin/glycerol metabolism